MKNMFIGGSRRILRLNDGFLSLLNRITKSNNCILIGDANGADRLVQEFFVRVGYSNVTVYCTGSKPRNNAGSWTVRKIESNLQRQTFEFYSVKDRAMAHDADSGLMIWDGQSVGTIMNAVRLLGMKKSVVLFHSYDDKYFIYRSIDQLNEFIHIIGAPLEQKILDITNKEFAAFNTTELVLNYL